MLESRKVKCNSGRVYLNHEFAHSFISLSLRFFLFSILFRLYSPSSCYSSSSLACSRVDWLVFSSSSSFTFYGAFTLNTVNLCLLLGSFSERSFILVIYIITYCCSFGIWANIVLSAFTLVFFKLLINWEYSSSSLISDWKGVFKYFSIC